jgi:oxalate decarboxylase/phosphoglucose isomerase-like protein (cupin superfamily)
MNPAFKEIETNVWSEIFKVVFFPDRIYHDEYLNATRSSRYRYNVQEVRGYLDITVLKGEVYMDGLFLSNFVRLEYRGGRLVEQTRSRNRFLGDRLIAWMRLTMADGRTAAETRLTLHWDPWVECYQAEVWGTLEPPETSHHDFMVLDMMAADGSITRVADLVPLLANVKDIKQVELAFREAAYYEPFYTPLSDDDAAWDNDFTRTHQEPRSDQPSDPQNTVSDQNYLLDFQRGWFKRAAEVKPVRYRNAMMEADKNPDARDDNIIAMRWLFQRELGGSMIFFHEVTIPPGKVEGNHQHIGSEELYYIVAGNGIAYLRVGDDPATDGVDANGKPLFATVSREVMGIGPKDFKELPVSPGCMIFTKSGGMHGIRNTSKTDDLKFVAFLYHSS